MKGISVLVGATLIIVITISAIFIALNSGQPAVDRTREILVMQEGKGVLLDFDNAIKSVLSQGNMSARHLQFRIIEGFLVVDEDNDIISFSMESKAQIVGDGVSKIEEGINVTGGTGIIYLNLSYTNVDIINSFELGKGNREVTIRNEGYDQVIEKQIISIT